ncbi:MAG: hypothetical protein HQ562_00460 [Candidatus Marinimicrobia bacterium]|nr:hypothetical protein [Candidatus Neomarinimicrobiota bacterium]
MIEYGDTIVAATGGGLLIFDRNTKTFSTLTNIDGLVTTDLQAVAIDPYGNLWLGGGEPDGLFQVYDLRKKQSLNDFADFGFFEVTGFATNDSIVYGIFRENQDIGLIEFIYQDGRFIYRDVYRNWPIALGNIESVIIYDDYVWVGTDYGLLQGNWKLDNLKDPDNWTLVAGMSGNITTMRRYGDELLIVNDRIVYLVRLPDLAIIWQWNYFANSYLFKDIVRTPDGEYWGILKRTFIKLSETAKHWQFPSDYTLNNLLPLTDNSIITGTGAGFAVVDTTTRRMKRYIPNAPVTNQFSAVTVLSDGRVVAGSKYGLAIKEPEGWRNIVADRDTTIVHTSHDYRYYSADTLPIHFGGFIADLEQGPDGLVYCAVRGTHPVLNTSYKQRGGGIIIIDIDNPTEYTLIDTAVLDYFADEYMVVKDLEFDPLGNLWVADTYVTTKLIPLHVRSADGNWGHYSALNSNYVLGLGADALAFDRWGRVWIGSLTLGSYPSGVTNGGLAVLNYTGNPTDPETFQWTLENEGENIWSIAITAQNILYLLTPDGLAWGTIQNSMTDPLRNLSDPRFPNISFGEGSRVKIDPRGNAWTISPDDGVNVLLENATYWPNIAGLRFDNSMLLSNNVTDIDFDEDKGLAYITSKRGLNVLKIPFARKKSANESLKIFPSPYHIPNESPLVIDGIKDFSSIKIMTVAGDVIRTMKAGSSLIQGYQAFWDGRDQSGNWANSGVYLIFMYNNDNLNEVAKITVIRH